METPIEVSASSQFEIFLTQLVYIRSQNETILQNQSFINAKIQEIMEHLGVELNHEWSLDNSNFNKENNELTIKNAISIHESIVESLKK